MVTINPYDYWQKNWDNASKFFESKGNVHTLSKLKNKWYNDFMQIFKDIESSLNSKEVKK